MIYMTASLPKETLSPPPLWVTRRDVKWLEIANFKPIFPLQFTHLGALPQLISRWDVVLPLHMLCYRGLGTSQTLNASCWPYPQNGCRHPLLGTAGPSRDLQPLPGPVVGQGSHLSSQENAPFENPLILCFGGKFWEDFCWLRVPGCQAWSPVRRGADGFQRPPAQPGPLAPPLAQRGQEQQNGAQQQGVSRKKKKKRETLLPALRREEKKGEQEAVQLEAGTALQLLSTPQRCNRRPCTAPLLHCWDITSSLTPFSIISGKPSRLGNNSAQASRGYFKIFSLSLSEKTAVSFYAIWKFPSHRRAVGCWRGPSPALLPNSDIQSTKDKTACLHQSWHIRVRPMVTGNAMQLPVVQVSWLGYLVPNSQNFHPTELTLRSKNSWVLFTPPQARSTETNLSPLLKSTGTK